MKDKYGIEMLPSKFRGTGKYKDCFYKLKQVKGNIVFYEVFDGFDYRYEVAQIKIKIYAISGLAYERYPSDEQLGESLWRFDDGFEALEFFKLKVQ